MSEITWGRAGDMSRQRQLARLLVEERKARKLRQQDLAYKLHQHQSLISRLESGARPIDVCEFLNLAEAIGFDPSVALKRVQNGACNGSSLDEALAVVKAAGFRINKPKSPKHKNQVGPTCVAEFADGTITRMSTFTSLEKLDWDRGVRLSQAAYQSRHPGALVPPAIISVHFEQDGKVLAQCNGGSVS
jgi:transcriptional regulator with XRE-family HTH domain